MERDGFAAIYRRSFLCIYYSFGELEREGGRLNYWSMAEGRQRLAHACDFVANSK